MVEFLVHLFLRAAEEGGALKAWWYGNRRYYEMDGLRIAVTTPMFCGSRDCDCEEATRQRVYHDNGRVW